MKRNTDALTKFNNLKVRLGIKRYEAAGILELIWHLTARETPQGDIGRRSNQDIATYVEWPGEPSVLINGLIDTRWLDTHPIHRLIVHAWPEHCEDSIHMALARKIMLFADGTIPNLKRLSKDERERLMPCLMALKNDDSARFATELRKTHPLLEQGAELKTDEVCAQNDDLCAQKPVRTALPEPEPEPEPSQAKPLPEPVRKSARVLKPDDFIPGQSVQRPQEANGKNNGTDQKNNVSSETAWTCFKTALTDYGVTVADVEEILKKARSLFTEFKCVPRKKIICDAMAVAFKAKNSSRTKSVAGIVCAWLIKAVITKDAPYETDKYYTGMAERAFDRLSGAST